MKYYSTNSQVENVSPRDAVMQGLAADGGLFMPASVPQLPNDFLTDLLDLSLPDIAHLVLQHYFSDVPRDTFQKICLDAFNFPCPLVQLSENVFVLELFHGPTLAFKDFGARFMSRLISYYMEAARQEAVVLVATSGDTGSAVAHGFFRVPGIRVILLYPEGMVSRLQEQQLTTLGENITALRVSGTFDDCQALVKEAFLDRELRSKLTLLSANSINFARLAPQSVYYFYAMASLPFYARPINVSVPCGNLGNLTAGVLAKHMGLPIARFIASVNKNDSFSRYLTTGHFEPQPSISTISNAMDVGNPSNFARLLRLYENDHERMCQEIVSRSFSDRETTEAMCKIFDSTGGYLTDPHTTVGYLGLSKFMDRNNIGVILATAHPAKFSSIVEEATGQRIVLPPALAECQYKQKHVQPMTVDFPSLKGILLD